MVNKLSGQISDKAESNQQEKGKPISGLTTGSRARTKMYSTDTKTREGTYMIPNKSSYQTDGLKKVVLYQSDDTVPSSDMPEQPPHVLR